MAHRLPVGCGLPGDVEVAPAQGLRVEAEQWRTPPEDVLDHEHALWAAEAAEGGLRGLVRLRDPAVHPHVRDPVGVVDVAEGPGQHRLGQVEAPAAVRRQGCVEGLEPAVAVEADPPLRVEPVPLARHRHVLVAAEPQPDRPTGDGTERGDGGEAVGLHLLAAEAAPHPQALDGHLVAVQPEDVRHDLLRLGRVLRAALDEHLPRVVDDRERGVGLQVEVLLAGQVQLTAEDVLRADQPRLDVPALHVGLRALEALGRDCLTHGDQRRQHLVVDLDHLGAQPSGLQRLAEDPADRVAEEHHLVGEERLVVLDARVVDARHVDRGEHPHHAGTASAGAGSRRVTRARAWSAWTGYACRTPPVRSTRSSV
jgi:hypothetical protein